MYEELISNVLMGLNDHGDGQSQVIPYLFYKKNCFLTNHRLYQFSTKISTEQTQSTKSIGVDLISMISSSIKTEMAANIQKEIFSSIQSDEKIDFIDIRNVDPLPVLFLSSNSLKIVENFILSQSQEYKNIITTAKIASELQDSSSFQWDPLKSGLVGSGSGNAYQVGVIFGMGVWVNPYLQFNDNRIIFYNDIEIDIKDTNCTICDEISFSPRIVSSYRLSVNVGQTLLVYLIADEKCKNFEKFTSFKINKRDEKIDEIIK